MTSSPRRKAGPRHEGTGRTAPGPAPGPGPLRPVVAALHRRAPGLRRLLRLHRQRLRLHHREHRPLLHRDERVGRRRHPHLPAHLLALAEAGGDLHPPLPPDGLSHRLHPLPRLGPHPEDPHHPDHDPHVDELPDPHLRLDDHPAGHRHPELPPARPAPAPRAHHRHRDRRHHRHGV